MQSFGGVLKKIIQIFLQHQLSLKPKAIVAYNALSPYQQTSLFLLSVIQ